MDRSLGARYGYRKMGYIMSLLDKLFLIHLRRAYSASLSPMVIRIENTDVGWLLGVKIAEFSAERNNLHQRPRRYRRYLLRIQWTCKRLLCIL